MWQSFCSNKIVKFLASLKLAVCLIILFAILMAWGTISESMHNTQFAKWQVYLSTPFIICEVFLFLNILFAALVRLPFKKRLTGFYTIHAGLLILMLGASATAIWGIDGSLRLLPDKKSSAVVINDPTFYAFYNRSRRSEPTEFIKELPKVASEIDSSWELMSVLDYDITIEKFIPFAKPKLSWIPLENPKEESRVVQFTLKNAMMSQAVEVSSLKPDSQKRKVGPLTAHLLTAVPSRCLDEVIGNQKINYLYASETSCVSFEKLPETQITKQGVSITPSTKGNFKEFIFKDVGSTYKFYPSLSTSPVDQDMIVDSKAQAKLLNLSAFRQGPQVIFFKDKRLLFGKENKWANEAFEAQQPVKLPWMGLELTVNQRIVNKKQKTEWFYSPPEGKDSNRHFAALVTLKHRYNKEDTQTFWVGDSDLESITTKEGFSFDFLVGNKLHYLPFETSLTKFKMDTNPGTNDPASYESFVNVLNQDGSTQEAHIFMNNPLKKGKFTLYQASYFPIENTGQFGTVLSVNFDPGRFWKYLGSLLIVFGSILHFILRSPWGQKKFLKSDSTQQTKKIQNSRLKSQTA